LQKAHHIAYNKALADIISMVKHAARQQEPLLTAAERVERAFERLTAGQTFTDEQLQWLERIRSHLVVNLSVNRDDFDLVPVFAREGGWARADRVFGGRLLELVGRLNREMAA
jgi:type I restriction enzyme R subunit